MSSAARTGTNRGTQCSQLAPCPWPKPPPGRRRRTEEEALQRSLEGAQTPSHSQAGPAAASLLWTHMQLKDPTSVAHLSHVFESRPPADAAYCRARSGRDEGGTGRSMPGPAAGRRRRPYGAWRRARWLRSMQRMQLPCRTRRAARGPSLGRPPFRPSGPSRGGSPDATASNAPGREGHAPGTLGPRGGPLQVLDAVAQL